jgi:hypothetical protein
MASAIQNLTAIKLQSQTVAINPLDWRETAPGRYERAFDEVEQFMEAWSSWGAPYGQQDVLVNALVRYNTERSDIVEALKNAWTIMRYQRPSLAAYPKKGRFVYDSFEKTEDWLEETFIVSESTPYWIYAKGIVNPRPVLRVFPKSNEVMLSAPHTNLDGNGSMIFFDSLFRLVERPEQINTSGIIDRLSRPLSTVAHIPDANKEQIAKAAVQIESLFPPVVGLPFKGADQPPTAMETEETNLSKEETDSVIEASKAAGFTVTEIIHTAVNSAVQTIAGETGECRCMVPMSLRRVLGDVGKDYATQYVGGIFFNLPPNDFMKTAAAMKENYHDAKAENYDKSVHTSLLKQLTPLFSQPPPIPPNWPALSSLGVAETYMQSNYGRVSLGKYEILVNTVVAQPRLFLHSFKGELNLSCSYNASYFDRTDIQKFLDTIMDELFKGLDIVDKRSVTIAKKLNDDFLI